MSRDITLQANTTPVGKAHPFFAGEYHGQAYSHLSAEDRIRAVAGFDPAQCRAALGLHDLQKTVRVAIERHLKKLGVAL